MRDDDVDQGDRPARRQSRRIVGRLRRDLARADDHARRRSRRGRSIVVDVGPGGVGRLLHRDAGARDRRAARHAHRIDRHLRRQVRDRRHARQARRQHGDACSRARTPTSISPFAPFTPEQREKIEESMQVFYDEFVRRSPTAGTRRRRRSTRSRRAASGPASRRESVAWSTCWAGSTRRLPSPSSARGIPADEDVELVVYPAAPQLLRSARGAVGRSSGAAGVVARLAGGAERQAASPRSPRRSGSFRRGEPLALMPFAFVR